jgi:hypothetical protein
MQMAATQWMPSYAKTMTERGHIPEIADKHVFWRKKAKSLTTQAH